MQIKQECPFCERLVKMQSAGPKRGTMLGHYEKRGDWQGGKCPGSFLTVNEAKAAEEKFQEDKAEIEGLV